MNKTIGKQIKQIREKYNLSQERFGQKIGLTGKAISSYETGRAIPSLRVLENISQKYRVSFTSLTEQDNDELSCKIKEIEKLIQELKCKVFEYSI